MNRVTLVSSLQKGKDSTTFCQQSHLNTVIQAAHQYAGSYQCDVTNQDFVTINYTGLLSNFSVCNSYKPKTEIYFTGTYAGLTTLVGILYPSGQFEKCDPTAISCYKTVELLCEKSCSYKSGNTPGPIVNRCYGYKDEKEISKYGDAISCMTGCTYTWEYGVRVGSYIIHHGGSDPYDERYYKYCYMFYNVKEGVQRVDLSNACISIYKKFLV